MKKKQQSVRSELIYTICGSVLGVFCGAWIATMGMTQAASAMMIQKETTHHQQADAYNAPAVEIALHAERINSVSRRLHKNTFNN